METQADGTHGGVVVILCDTMEKQDMDAALDDRLEEETRQGTKFVCRVGSPMIPGDLAKGAVNDASSVIVLCGEEAEPEKADSGVMRVVLSLVSVLPPSSQTIVLAEIRDVDTAPLITLVAGHVQLETICSHGEYPTLPQSQPCCSCSLAMGSCVDAALRYCRAPHGDELAPTRVSTEHPHMAPINRVGFSYYSYLVSGVHGSGFARCMRRSLALMAMSSMSSPGLLPKDSPSEARRPACH